MKTLIADCGATKTAWLCSGGRTLVTPGVNFSHTPREQLEAVFSSAAAQLGPEADQIFVYAAGLVEAPSVRLERWFPGARVHYASDLLAAARATCGREKGVAAILGTGSGTCLWDGEKMVRQLPGGGYILGDEGSAAVLGRQFLSDYIRNLIPSEVVRDFESRFPSAYPDIVRSVYGSEAPARYLGSLAPFVLEHYAQPYIKELVDKHFRRFFERCVVPLGALPLGVVGGFGYAARDILRTIGPEYGVQVRSILPSPMEGLKTYHGI